MSKKINVTQMSKNIKSIDILLKLIDNTDLVSSHIKDQAKDARVALNEITTEVKNNIL